MESSARERKATGRQGLSSYPANRPGDVGQWDSRSVTKQNGKVKGT